MHKAGPAAHALAYLSPSDCPTPPLSPVLERSRTPPPKDVRPEMSGAQRMSGLGADAYHVDEEPAGMRTPRAAGKDAHDVHLPAPQTLSPGSLNAVQAALVAPSASHPIAARRDARRRAVLRGHEASARMSMALQDGNAAELREAMQQLGPVPTAWGLRYDNFSVLRTACKGCKPFACIRVIIDALHPDELRTLMRTQSGIIIMAAQTAGEIDYANALIRYFGHEQMCLLSER